MAPRLASQSATSNLSCKASQSATLNLRAKIEEHAKSLGFDLVGFSPAKIDSKYPGAFDKWLAAGHEGSMSYMRKIKKRRDLTKILPGAKSIIVLATNYYREQPRLSRGHGIVARYAYGRDYHKVIGKRLRQLEKFIQELAAEEGLANSTKYTDSTKNAQPADSQDSTKTTQSTGYSRITKAYVDTGPILERALAEQAGIGRIGKNSCFITKEFGSWVFLSEIITTLDLDSSVCDVASKDRWSNPKAPSANICGNCTRCIDACPTGAIIAPGIIDARLCISYLTIENKDKIPPHLAKIIAKTKRLYGCDICQEVCPHNSARQKSIEQGAANANTFTAQNSIHRNLTEPRIAGSQLSLKKIVAIKTDQQFLETFAGSPLMRAKKHGLRRNAEILRREITSPKNGLS